MKGFKKILLLFLALTLVLIATACGGDTECTEHKDEDKNGKCDICEATVDLPKNDAELTLVEGGEAKFQLVVAKGMSGTATKLVNDLAKELEDLGLEVAKVAESEDNVVDCEILFGNVTTRGEEYDFNEHTLGLKGYAVKVIGEKVIVTADSDSALADAISCFKKDILGITKSTDELTDVTVSSANDKVEIQSNYRIDGISVDGKELSEFYISVDKSNKDMLSAATAFQTAIYTAKGYWLDIVDENTARDGNRVEINLVDTAGNEGFEIYIKDGNFVVDVEFANKAAETLTAFLSKNVSTVTSGSVKFDKNFTYSANTRYVYYSEFTIKNNDGTVNDFETLLAAHEYANKYGHTVRADAGAVYTIGIEARTSIPIQTNVEWGNATFRLKDKEIPVESGRRTMYIFSIVSSFSNWMITYDADSAEVKNLANGFKASEITNIGFAPGYPAIINVIDENNYAYNRTHVASDPNAKTAQHEVIVVDADGNIQSDANFLLDYTGCTKLEVVRIDDETVKVSGGTFITDANNAPRVYTSYGRGIKTSRSNTVISGVTHKIENEGDTGAPYSSFFKWEYTYNYRLENSTLQGHKSYIDSTNGSTMGSYDLGGGNSSHIYIYNCTQSNFFQEGSDVNGNPSSKYWGVMGSNYNKNITYDSCRLSRLDAHAGVKNVKVINSEIIYFTLIGGGDAYIENTIIYGTGVDEETGKQRSHSAITLRGDYGATWNGTVTLKDCTFHNSYTYSNADLPCLITASWKNFPYYGPGTINTSLPNVIIDNLTMTNPNPGGTYVFYGPFDSSKHVMDKEMIDDETPNQNVMNISVNVTVKNNKQGYVFIGSSENYVCSKVNIILEEN